MPTTIELRAALQEGGSARRTLQSLWGAWADEFCDALLQRLIQPEHDCKIHLWVQRAGQFQVNVDNKITGAYTNDVTDDPLRTIGERLARTEQP